MSSNVESLKFREKHIKDYVENGYSFEEMRIKYNLTQMQLVHQLSRFIPKLVYNEEELYYEFEEYIKRNHYMTLFNGLGISESVRHKIANKVPVYAKYVILLLKFFAINYEIQIEKNETKNQNFSYPKYVMNLPKFSREGKKGYKQDKEKIANKTADDDYNALSKARERELRLLHEMIGVRRNTLSQALKRKGVGIATINEVLEIVDDLCVEVSEFSIKCEKTGVGNKILDNIANKRISQYK